jgi:type IV fimbrial biogenesis protein FimT
MRRIATQKGFTLIEMLTTMAVAGIVLAIAAFSFKDVLWRNQVNTAANDFVTALNFARSEAVTRGQSVTVCRSINGTTEDDPAAAVPVPSCSTAAGAGWETGYIVFVDANGNGERDTNEELLRVCSGPDGGVTIQAEGVKAKNRICYAATGFFPGVFNDTVKIANASKTINVVLSKNGRVRTEQP